MRYSKAIFTVLFLLFSVSLSYSQIDSNTSVVIDTLIADTTLIADSIQTFSEPQIEVEELKEGSLRASKTEFKTFEFFLLLGILVLFGVIRLMDHEVYNHLFKKFLNTSLSIRPLKNVFQYFKLSNYVLNVLFFLISGLYLYYIMARWGLHPEFIIGQGHWLQMLFYISCVAVTYVVKLSFLSFVGYIFDMKKFSREYAFNILLVQQVMAVVLYPFLWMIVFMGTEMTKVGIVASIVIFALAFFNRYARSRDSIASLLKLNKFHFFIYLCTSEILPLLIIGKIMIG